MKRKWSAARTVTMPRVAPYESDQWIYDRYRLALLINAHVADFQTDDEVSDALQNVRRTIPLPDFFEHY
jgi:hypothetical protein